ncbi:MAG: helix-turn-helix transcriptional regulator [Patescibacteria group bacterium]
MNNKRGDITKLLRKLRVAVKVIEDFDLRALRRELKETQTEMAQMLGVSLRTYSTWERKESNTPLRTLKYLCTPSKKTTAKRKR